MSRGPQWVAVSIFLSVTTTRMILDWLRSSHPHLLSLCDFAALGSCSSLVVPMDALCDEFPLEAARAVCLGSGRFLRAVLVPALSAADLPCIVVQTRGDSFPKLVAAGNGLYDWDSVETDGRVRTTSTRVLAAGTCGSEEGLAALLELPRTCPQLSVVAVGVTEAGLSKGSAAMGHLAQLLLAFKAERPDESTKISVLCTDNVPGNGRAICEAVMEHLERQNTDPGDVEWIHSHVTFHNSMVDRITSHREGDPNTPRAEPLPAKALVFEDINGVLPRALAEQPGVFLRSLPGEIEEDHELKLCIANGIHSASVYALALSGLEDTTAFRPGAEYSRTLAHYIDSLFLYDILPGLREELNSSEEEIREVYEDWRARLRHPHFGLSAFFISQNSSIKLQMRLWPSIARFLCSSRARMPSGFMAFAVAAMLRFLMHDNSSRVSQTKLVGRIARPILSGGEASYAGKRYNLAQGWYEFEDGDGSTSAALPDIGEISRGGGHPSVKDLCVAISTVFDRMEPKLEGTLASLFVRRVAEILAKLLGSESPMEILRDLVEEDLSSPLPRSRRRGTGKLADVVREEVRRVDVIDVHTHLFPPQFEELCLYGIDELLTYHYLVAEFFETSDGVSPSEFYSLSKREQADIIWNAIFVQKPPVSEAARGVLTVLKRLGLGAALKTRDLGPVRTWFAEQDPIRHSENILQLAGVKYAVMTNIPFDAKECPKWDDKIPFNRSIFKTALRVDLILMNDSESVFAAAREAGFEGSAEGCLQYLGRWADIYKPEYLMASTPHNFEYPFPFQNGESPAYDLVAEVLVPFAKEHKLPLFFKVGAIRALNPSYKMAGDGVEVASLDFITHMCRSHPDLKFFVTVLSRENQHTLAVLGNKFRNLHVYGCWWYCNNPSIIADTTKLRLEILGPNFTAQHSDCRVLEQLLYKWDHSRLILAEAILEQVDDAAETGWPFTRGDVRKLVHRIMGGGAYDDFMQKKL